MTKVRHTIPIVLVFLIITGLCLYYSLQKSGMFIDEIYTYGLSNSERTPFVTDINDGQMVDEILTQEQFHDYLTVQEGEQFHFGSVYYNQTKDVHPPLHYWLIHLVSSFVPDSYSKWIGLSINYVFFMATLWVLYLLTDKLFDSKKLAGVTTTLYGLSTLAFSTMLMIRMYMVLTFFTLLLAYWIACLLRGGKKAKMCVLVSLTIFFGLMTQYYYIFYAFFVCAAYDIHLLLKKQFRMFWAFSISALVGVALLVIAYPACLQHLFADKLVSGSSMIDSIKNPSDWHRRFLTYLYSVNYEARWITRTGKVAVFLVLLRCVWCGVKKQKMEWRFFDSLVIILPAFFAFVLVAIASPVIPLRYIYNLIPIFALAVALFLSLALRGLDSVWIQYGEEVAAFSLVVIMVATAIRVQPDFLYPEQKTMNALASKYGDSPCVYFDDNYVAPITNDMLQLIHYKDVFIANDASSDKLHAYLENHSENESVIVYVDNGISEIWSSRYDEKEVLQSFEVATGYENAQELYEGAWLLTSGR